MATPRVLVLRAPGINCDEETALAWTIAGATVETWHVNRLVEDAAGLDRFQVLTIPGGFSYGDDLGAGRILATRLQAGLGDALKRFRDRGGLLLGICNGFQVLVRAGLLPGEETGHSATLTLNDSGRFESRWVRLRPRGGSTPFLTDDEVIELPVAHGEGKFLTSEGGNTALLDSGRVVLRYVDEAGDPTDQYPDNPNGTPDGIAGVCDSTGRVFGLMPHPERHIEHFHHPRWTRREDQREGDGLRIFRNAVRACS